MAALPGGRPPETPRASGRARRGRRGRVLAAAAVALAAAGLASALVLRGESEGETGVGGTTWPASAGSVEAVESGPAPAGTTAATTVKERDQLPSREEQERAVERFLRLGYPIYCGGGKRGRYVALTFDDGPGSYTELALRILRHVGARATFFLVGRNLGAYPKLPRREEALGALGNHSWTHPVLPDLPRAELARELSRTKQAIEDVANGPVRLFRPPYEAHSPAVDAEARSLGMLQVLWSVDSEDSLGADYLGIYRNVKAGLRPGAIVLLHENRGQTIRALKFHILPELKRRGLRAVSVPQLLALDPPSVAQLRRGFAGCG